MKIIYVENFDQQLILGDLCKCGECGKWFEPNTEFLKAAHDLCPTCLTDAENDIIMQLRNVS